MPTQAQYVAMKLKSEIEKLFDLFSTNFNDDEFIEWKNNIENKLNGLKKTGVINTYNEIYFKYIEILNNNEKFKNLKENLKNEEIKINTLNGSLEDYSTFNLTNYIKKSRGLRPFDTVSSYSIKVKEILYPDLPLKIPCIIHRPIRSKHYGLYIGNGLVIHYFPDEKSKNFHEITKWNATTKVRITTIERFLDGYNNYFQVLSENTNTPKDTIALALLNLGRNNWHLLAENCQHFVLFCIRYPTYGEDESLYLLHEVDETIIGAFFTFVSQTAISVLKSYSNFLIWKNNNNEAHNIYLNMSTKILQAKTKEEVIEIVNLLPKTEYNYKEDIIEIVNLLPKTEYNYQHEDKYKTEQNEQYEDKLLPKIEYKIEKKSLTNIEHISQYEENNKNKQNEEIKSKFEDKILPKIEYKETKEENSTLIKNIIISIGFIGLTSLTIFGINKMNKS